MGLSLGANVAKQRFQAGCSMLSIESLGTTWGPHALHTTHRASTSEHQAALTDTPLLDGA